LTGFIGLFIFQFPEETENIKSPSAKKIEVINFPLKADLFSWFLSETWKLNIILKILLILSEIKIL